MTKYLHIFSYSWMWGIFPTLIQDIFQHV